MSITDTLKFLNLDREKVLNILHREEEIRFSKKYIQECNAVADIPNGWLDVTAKMQKKLVEEFGFIDPIENTLAVNIIRRAYDIYPDKQIKNSVVQFRENIANKGNYKEGDEFMNLTLHNIDGKSIYLYDILDSKKYNVILAGSHT